jgi:hypothetical protein
MLEFIWRQDDDEEETKTEITVVEQEASSASSSSSSSSASVDLEASPASAERPTGLLTPLHVGLAVGLNIFISLNTVRVLIEEYLKDGYYPRLFIALSLPLQMAVSQVCLTPVPAQSS